MDSSVATDRRERPKRALLFVALAAGVAGACSRSSRGQADGGPTGAGGGTGGNIIFGPPLSGRQSFDVVATLSLGDGGGPSSLQSPVPFTLVLDPDAGRAFEGAQGPTADIALTKRASGELGLGDFSVAVAATVSTTLDFMSTNVTASAAALSGTGAGQAAVVCLDCGPNFNGPFTAMVTGVPDVTPPKLLVGGAPASPLVPFDIAVSEPLPLTSAARLLAEDGTAIDLVPEVESGDFIFGFGKPNVVLPTGVGLSLAVDQVVDFAGVHALADPPLRFAYFPTPPLVPQDGFESAGGATLGGATVITAGSGADGGASPDAGGVGGPPPIAGMRSVYVGGRCAPSPTGTMVATSLSVRLAVPPGATKLVFSYQLVGFDSGGGLSTSGTVRVGSVGKTPVSVTLNQLNLAVMTPFPWPDGKAVDVSGVATEEVALAPDVTSEVLVEIDPLSICGGPLGRSDGILLDDLRLE